jgi:formylglycine-generating enzyme required for sulfatase activity
MELRPLPVPVLLLASSLILGCGGRTSTKPRPDLGPSDGSRPDLVYRVDASPDLHLAPDIAIPDLYILDLPVPDIFPPDTWGPCKHPPVQKSCAGGWCTIPAGCFVMGSPAGELCRSEDEELHQVTLTRSFKISTFEVTQDQFKALLGYNPSFFTACGAGCPVENVSWHEAAAYCNALSAKEGRPACYACTGSKAMVSCDVAPAYSGAKSVYSCKGYRLPTEAEREYAYRAGATTAFYNGTISSCHINDPVLDKIGWYDMNAGATTHPVGQKQPNAWGLYDMAGNVREWVNDHYFHDLGTVAVTDPVGPKAGKYRVLRGGGWWDHAWFHRAASRRLDKPDFKSKYIGLRCARSL